MPPQVTRYFMTAIAFAAVGGFMYLYGSAVYKTLNWSAPEPRVEFGAAYVYVATILAGLVGGVAAMVFNERLPAAAPPGPGGVAPSATGPQPAAQAAVAAVAPKANWDGLVIASAVYISGYFLIGIAAIIAWVHADTNTPDLVKNLALIAIGLFVAIIRQFLNVPPPG